MDLTEVQVDRIISPNAEEHGVVLRTETKAFVIFVATPEAVAVKRELDAVPAPRPMSHDLVANILSGFGIEVRKIVISSLVNNIFCATLLLSQEAGDEASSMRKEVRLDLRASDAIVVALKTKKPLWVSSQVLDSVQDVTPLL